jgi:hypothetical protein
LGKLHKKPPPFYDKNRGKAGRGKSGEMRVYIAKKLTFTTLIDHFTSLRAVLDTALPLRALVYSYQLIKLGLLTQSIRQQKLPPHMRNSAFDPAVRVALALGHLRSAEVRLAVASCFGKTQNNVIFQFKIECILAEKK